MTTAATLKRKKPEQLLFKVAGDDAGGLLRPADGYTSMRMRERGFRVGDTVLATFRKPVNPGAFRRAHLLGKMIAANVEEFTGMDAHTVLKRLQIEAVIECDVVPVILNIMGQRIKLNHPTPRSMAWENMGGDEFDAMIRRFSNYVAETYWPDCTPEQIERMAELMPEAA